MTVLSVDDRGFDQRSDFSNDIVDGPFYDENREMSMKYWNLISMKMAVLSVMGSLTHIQIMVSMTQSSSMCIKIIRKRSHFWMGAHYSIKAL